MASQISNRELVDAYIRFRGFKRISGDDSDISCLVPLLLLDMHLQLFNNSVIDIECRHLTQKSRTRWRNCYNTFNRGSFFAFKNEYEDKIMELMDSLGDYISNNIMFLRVAVMDVFKDKMDTETQKIVADIVICNTFAQIACSWWGSAFKMVSQYSRLAYKPENNKELRGMIKYSIEFLNGYVNDALDYRGKVNLQDFPTVVNATKSLDKKITEWANLQSKIRQ